MPKKLLVGLYLGKSKAGDSVRGIGVQNSELAKAMEQVAHEDVLISEVTNPKEFSKYDIVHFSVFRPFFISLPLIKPLKTKFVLTIHDLIPLLYPDVYKPGIRGSIKFLINKILLKLYVSKIITISETSKKDICRFLAVNPEDVVVTDLGPKASHHRLKPGKWQEETAKKYGLKKEFVFYLGDLNYNKNIPTLVNACKKANIQLVITGKRALEVEKLDLNHPEHSHLKPIVKDLVNPNIVLRTGFVDDEEVNKIMNLSLCVVQPSYYEGFGLSVIHGFASGVPVIISKTQVLVEAASDAALVFDPNSVDQLADCINKLRSDKNLVKLLIKKGEERVKHFSWKRCAEETLDVYRKVNNQK